MEQLKPFSHDHLLNLENLRPNPVIEDEDEDGDEDGDGDGDGDEDEDEDGLVVMEDRHGGQVAMEQLKHFSHDHLLHLENLRPNPVIEDSDLEDEDEDKDGLVVMEDRHGGQCNMCKDDIYSFHLCYYKCYDCDYKLHKFCAELPTTLNSHPLHPGHELTLSKGFQFRDLDLSFTPRIDSYWMCSVCNLIQKLFFHYHCSICKFNLDIVCATMSQQKMDHPSHPHQLTRIFGSILSHCSACADKHEGIFYQCTICFGFRIHLECALLPTKLSIQLSTDDNFSHSHLLTLSYSFPYIDQDSKSFPHCKVCGGPFEIYKWLYKCDKCRYYVHDKCAASKTEPFMSIFLPAGLGKTYKNFKDKDYPNLLRCPFPDESSNLVKHQFLTQASKFFILGKNEEMLNHFSHQHPLILIDSHAMLSNRSISLHDPMKKIQVLCDGCVRPITSAPFYKCSQYVQHCGFVLHEWCAKLLSQVDNPDHPEHTLVLMQKVPKKVFGLFDCQICLLPSNGFAYGCTKCEFYVDINCAFIPEEITHESHPNHLLFRIKASSIPSIMFCDACYSSIKLGYGYHCPICDFYVHIECALLLLRDIRHKYDKHPMSLRYGPVENHIGEYFCEICEEEIFLLDWLYHCTTCAWSMHTSCVPLILQSEQAIYSECKSGVFYYINVKFGRTVKLKNHLHSLVCVQGIESHGQCTVCHEKLQYKIIYKCMECELAVHHVCISL